MEHEIFWGGEGKKERNKYERKCGIETNHGETKSFSKKKLVLLTFITKIINKNTLWKNECNDI